LLDYDERVLHYRRLTLRGRGSTASQPGGSAAPQYSTRPGN
jgi:hypothetical protein